MIFRALLFIFGVVPASVMTALGIYGSIFAITDESPLSSTDAVVMLWTACGTVGTAGFWTLLFWRRWLSPSRRARIFFTLSLCLGIGAVIPWFYFGGLGAQLLIAPALVAVVYLWRVWFHRGGEMSNPSSDPAGRQLDSLCIEESPDRLRISWDNRKVKKDRMTFWFLLLFWIIWAPVTCLATAAIFISDSPVFLIFWCIVGWIGTIGIPLFFLQRLSSEWIEISPESISWGAVGPLAPKPKRMPMVEIDEFALGRYSDRSEQESMVTLNVYGLPKWRFKEHRHVLAHWLAREHKEALFNRIRLFASTRSLPLRLVIYQQGHGHIVYQRAD